MVKRSFSLIILLGFGAHVQPLFSYNLPAQTWNKIGAGCYALSGVLENNRNTPLLIRALLLNSLPKKDGMASIIRWCAQKAYSLQGEIVKINKPIPLRTCVLAKLNILGATSHYIGGSQKNHQISSAFHKSGDAAYKAHAHLAHYDGLLSGILDKTDLNKISHCLVLSSVTALITYLSYKAYKHYVAPSLHSVADEMIIEPTKNLYGTAKNTLKKKIDLILKKHEKNTIESQPDDKEIAPIS